MTSLAPDLTDRTFYPVEDDLGEHELQTYILELLRPLLARLMGERGTLAHVGSDQFIYWEKYAPTECVAPDLYVLPGVRLAPVHQSSGRARVAQLQASTTKPRRGSAPPERVSRRDA